MPLLISSILIHIIAIAIDSWPLAATGYCIDATAAIITPAIAIAGFRWYI